MLLKKINELFIFSCLIATFTPSLGAIDNNALRWFMVSFLIILYLSNKSIRSDIVFDKKTLKAGLAIVVLLCSSILASINKVEALVSSSKVLIILFFFFAVVNALRKIKEPLTYLSKIFSLILFFEVSFTLASLVFDVYPEFTGISMNRNISSFSILIKLPFLFLYKSLTRNNNMNSLLFSVVELFSIFSILVLESRAALYILFLVYFLLFFLKTYSNRRVVVFLSVSILSLLIYKQNFSSYLDNKVLNPINLAQDESFNYRLDYYKNAISLFQEKPFLGHGIGSWKIQSLRFQDYSESTILSPYYVHNDFLQLLMEIGIFGFAVYLLILINPTIYLLKKIKIPEYFILLISIFVFICDSTLNFPIHRSQEIIPFVVIIGFVFQNKNKTSDLKKSSKYYSNIIIIMSFLCSCFLFLEHNSLRLQGKIYQDYANNTFDLNYQNINKLQYSIPNLTANTVPLTTYLSRYYINDNNYAEAAKLLKLSSNNNPYDLITKELELKISIHYKEYETSLKQLNYLKSRYPNKDIYTRLYNEISSLINNKEH